MKNTNDKRTSKSRNTTSWCHLRQIRKQRVGEGKGGEVKGKEHSSLHAYSRRYLGNW